MAQNPQGFSNEIPMVAISSEESCESSAGVPLLAGEQREEAERVPSPTSEDSVSTIAPETGTATNSGQIDESTQAESFWQRRRLENYAGINRDHPDVWSLFTRSTASLNYSEPEDHSGFAASTIAEEHTCRHRGCLENHGGLENNNGTVCSKRTRAVNIARIAFSIIATELCEYYPWISKAKESRAFAILKEWLLESLALLLSISSFVAIVILLSTHNGQVQPDFVDQISINALVAIFSTVLRASVLFIITEVIGEMKWQWMESPRSLRDMEYFTNAGTGPWGSLKFLFFSWKPTWTFAGAFVVIASAAIGPFTQQASATYSCSSTVKGSAHIRVAKTMSTVITSEMRGAAIGSLMNGGTDRSSVIASLFECASESCTFEDNDGITHTSIGICSSCTEASPSLKDVVQLNNTDSLDDDSSGGREPLWPSGLNTSYAFKMTTEFKSSPESRGVRRLARQDVANKSLHDEMTVSIRALTLNSSTKGVQRYQVGAAQQPLGVLGIDCTVFPCLRRYYGQVINGTFNESVISQIPMSLVSNSTSSSKSSPGKDQEFGQLIEPCFVSGRAYNLSTISNDTAIVDLDDQNCKPLTVNGTSILVPVRCLGTISYSTLNSVQSFIDERTTGSCNVSGIGNPPSLAAVDCGDKWWLDSMFNGGEASFDSVSDAINRMVTSITNFIRVNGLGWDGRPDFPITGSSSKPAICVQAYWAWLLYPGVVLVLTTMLFVKTSLQSNLAGRRRPVWKSNVFPMVFYGVKGGKACSDGGDAQSDVKVPLLTLSEMGAVANQTVVWFDNDADAPGFVTETGENGLESVLADLKENGVSALSDKERVRPREKSEASGIVNFRAWLRRRRVTDDGTEP